MTLAEFLLARIAEDEEGARDVFRGDEWHLDGDWREDRDELVGGGKILASFTDEDRLASAHIVRRNPTRVLAECEAKRRIVAEHAGIRVGPEAGGVSCSSCQPLKVGSWPCPTLRFLALPYADHPDYRQEWRP